MKQLLAPALAALTISGCRDQVSEKVPFNDSGIEAAAEQRIGGIIAGIQDGTVTCRDNSDEETFVLKCAGGDQQLDLYASRDFVNGALDWKLEGPRFVDGVREVRKFVHLSVDGSVLFAVARPPEQREEVIDSRDDEKVMIFIREQAEEIQEALQN